MHTTMYPYAKSMETLHNKAIFDGIYEIRVRLTDAIERCKSLALTEMVMGYTESAQSYEALADELVATKRWIEKHMNSLVELA